MISVEAIRELFPNPQVSDGSEKGTFENTYCVGGAFLHYISDRLERYGLVPQCFPPDDLLARGLCLANADLQGAAWEDTTMASHFAFQIGDKNDDGQFERAWEVLELALAYRREVA